MGRQAGAAWVRGTAGDRSIVQGRPVGGDDTGVRRGEGEGSEGVVTEIAIIR